MSFPARTWSTGELVTASIMNEHIRDNQNYLKERSDDAQAIVDRVDNFSVSAEGANRSFDTTYQNETGSILFVSAVGYADGANGQLVARISENSDMSSPITVADEDRIPEFAYRTVFMIVPKDYYYRINGVSTSVMRWTEYTL